MNCNRYYILLFFLTLTNLIIGQKAELREVQTKGFTTFMPNEGQWEGNFYNRAKLGYGNLFTDHEGYKILLWDAKQAGEMQEEFHQFKTLRNNHVINYSAIHFNFLGASAHQELEYKTPTSWKTGFYIGNDSSKWAPSVQSYYQLVRKNVYPGIHFEHSTLENYAKSEWHVQPNANPGKIQIQIKGADSLALSEGNLVVYTSVGNLFEKAPVAWQIINQNKVKVRVAFELVANTIQFKVGDYNPKYPLIIDPVLVFSTYSGSVSDNFGFTATYNSKGELYSGGISNDIGGKYPVTAGAYQDTFNGGNNAAPVNLPSDITISKYSSDGSTLLFATYIGGKSLNDFPHSLVVNSNDELYVLGTSFSNSFPTKNAFDNTHNGNSDIVLFHFNEDCSQLLQSTYIGGSGADGLNAPLSAGTLSYNYADDFRGDIVTDANGNVYVATCSNSNNFPISDSASQKNNAGNRDAVIFSLDSNLSILRFSTFWGGSNDDAAYSVKINSHGTIYVGGGTASTDFPDKGSVYKDTFQGGQADGFVLKLDSVYGRIEKSSLFGTNQYDQAYFIDIDLKDRVYLAGQTEGNLGRTVGTYGKDNTGQFVAALDSTLQFLQFQTTFGNRINNPELCPTAFLVDNCFNIYFSGWGSNVAGHAGTTAGLEVKNANWPTTDGSDFYLMVMNKEAKGLIYASFIGGTNSDDHVDGGTSRFDKNGIVYQSVCASCPPAGSQLSDFPTTATSAFPTNLSIRCSNASFKLDFQITYFTEAKFNAPDKVCAGRTISFVNTGQGTSFNWDFGDGNSDTTRSPIHRYALPGIYTITLITIDSLSCNLADTFQRQIEILESPEAGFEVEYNPCKKGIVAFSDEGNLGNQFWDYDDGNTSSVFKPEHTYSEDGEFDVSQVITLANGCADTFIKNILLSSQAGGALTLYNTFTPNADALNACWAPDGVNTDCEEVEFKIYNRYGTLVFSSKLHGSCWNGNLANDKLEVAEGNYFYYLDIKRKDNQEEKKVYGVITLIR